MPPIQSRGLVVKRFIEGEDRTQSTLFPASLDEYVDEDNLVGVIDVFVDALDLKELGFDGLVPEATGRPSCHPLVQLKTYVYGYVQATIDAKHHLIIDHEVIQTGLDNGQLSEMATHAKDVIGADGLTVLADRGYFEGEQLRACDDVGITTFVPKPQTSSSKAKGRFSKQDFVCFPDEDAYRCPAGETFDLALLCDRTWLAFRRVGY